jgi:Fe-S cluster assembly iron-binding protein IscA
METTLRASDIQLLVSDSAVRQIQLMMENDYTLEGLLFRIKIGGKGCGGFTYDTGFSERHPDDLVIEQDYPLINFKLQVLMDPFTAFYTQRSTLDYLLDSQSNEEGFVLTNAADGEHKGKFFKDESKLPPWAKA